MSAPAGTSFFRSRWVDAPAHVAELEPTALPRGFRAAGVAAGIKPSGLDVGVLVSDEDATASAARFTTNARLGAPVIVSKEGELQRLRAIVANAGNSNVGTGRRGVETALASQAAAADALRVAPARIGLASTGIIARELSQDLLVAGVRAAAGELGPGADAFSQAILTTDAGPKRACLDVTLPSGSVRLAAQAKGAGMISPRFATMFCFVETDAQLDPTTLELLTGVTVKRSFDRISVDGQLSTSDTVFVIANGASGVRVEPETDDELVLGEALDALLRQLAIEVVADGEGCARTGRVVVRGDSELVERVARAVAESPLVKAALHGADPNFGRIMQAAGMALAGHPFLVDLEIEGRQVVSAGEEIPLDGAGWTDLESVMKAKEVEYELRIPGSGGETEVFFSDLSPAYAEFNSAYSS
ncbi:MAG: bifunctional ornithine acetyltransferase/N-acetylglutamate synthase [Thermoleophilaceae bacterium]